MNNKITVVPIYKTVIETELVKTIVFEHSSPIQPGQFYMIWIPGVDEIPMSVSMINKTYKGITFRIVGEATRQLYDKKPNDTIGIRGPYGEGFSLDGDSILFIAGGTGSAMIAPAVEKAIQQQKTVSVILGGKTKKDLFFVKRLQQTNATLHITTDDGSIGFKGTAAEKAEQLLNTHDFNAVYTCGPELMMKKLYQICENKDIIFEASLERYMKCGVGLCGQCVVGKGLRVCVEGPVFSKETLRNIADFGVFTRDASGKKTSIIETIEE
jgi:dihydroorotate dehydrogenase electron transfer subunit